jgi:hypothetical protein
MGEVESSRELERSLAELALALFAPGNVEGTLQQIVDLAVMTVDGCDVTGVFLVENEQVVTLACSDPVVVELDGLQFETNEGPCLDAVSQGGTFYAEDLAVDERWPRFGPAAAASGIRSVLAFRLSGERPSALNLYASYPAAFGATDRAKGLIFATLAGIALDTAMQREDDEIKAEQLRQGLLTRELIGQAQGILMERERIRSDQAFDVLRRASQHLNLRLREVAQRLVETGETPRTESGPPQ